MAQKRLLPREYIQLESIQGDGNSYIDTGVKGSNNTRVEEVLELLSLPSGVAGHTFGDFTDNTKAITMNFKQSGNSRFGNASLNAAFGTLTTAKHTYGVDKNGFSVDGVITASLTKISDFTTTGNLFWMSANYYSTVVNVEAKYYELKIWENNVLVRNFIPAKRRSDNVLGMYDLVSDTFYTNAGTGTFIGGNPVQTYDLTPWNKKSILFTNPASHGLPSGYTEVEHIEAVGTGVSATDVYYIDTGIACSLDMEVEINLRHSYTGDTGVNLLTPYSISKRAGVSGIALSHYSSGPAWAVKFGSSWENRGTMQNNTWHHVIHNKDEFVLNGTSFPISGAYTQNSNLYLMCNLWASTTLQNTKLQVKDVIVRKSGVVVFNGIACKQDSDGKYGFYDTVSGTFKGNGGTGTFTAGPEVPQFLLAPMNKSAVLSTRLPDGYTELEYIESSGRQYIQLPFGFDNTDEVDFKFSESLSETRDKYLVAPSSWNTNNNRYAFGRHNNRYTVGYGGTPTETTYLLPYTDYDDELPHIWHYKDFIFTVEDPALSINVSSIPWGGTTENLKLFYGLSSNTKGVIYYYHHKKTNAEYDLIPAQRKLDSAVGMYDLVSGQFFPNAGTGDFIAGPEVHTLYPTTKPMILRVYD